MKVSINAQIEEIDREITLRRQVYPRLVRKREMRESVGDMHIERMEAARTTLQWLRDNEADIRAHIEAKRT